MRGESVGLVVIIVKSESKEEGREIMGEREQIRGIQEKLREPEQNREESRKVESKCS